MKDEILDIRKKFEHKVINRKVKQVIKSAEEAWVEDQCNTIKK